MNKYIIYCTPEQTKKAFELGAQIITFGYPDLGEDKEKVLKWNRQSELSTTDDGGLMVGQIPTAEQMIGWLEERVAIQEVDVHGTNDYVWVYNIWMRYGAKPITSLSYSSRKEATLAAIDAALDYLIKNKK